MSVRSAAALALGAAAACVPAAGAAPGPAATVCGTGPGPLSYDWPVKPFERPHPVRGNFGDPRTVYWGLKPRASLGGSFTFHNGIDISAPDGTPVYPVVSGTAVEVGYDEIVVAAGTRRFQYWHLRARVRRGERVAAGRTMLGIIFGRARHVHLTEVDDGHVVDPLAPGHLGPYLHDTAPVIRWVRLATPHGPGNIVARGRPLGVVVDAFELPNLPPPQPWGDLPVAPSVVSWSLRTARGAIVVRRRIAVDFRRSLPRPRDFWRVYAVGTYQNSPSIGPVHYREPGRYLFHVPRGGLDTRALPAGRYVLRVRAADLCGHTASRSIRFELVGGLAQLVDRRGRAGA